MGESSDHYVESAAPAQAIPSMASVEQLHGFWVSTRGDQNAIDANSQTIDGDMGRRLPFTLANNRITVTKRKGRKKEGTIHNGIIYWDSGTQWSRYDVDSRDWV